MLKRPSQRSYGSNGAAWILVLAAFVVPAVESADSDLWTTHSGPGTVVAGVPFTVFVGYGNHGPDPATSAYVNSYFTAPMGLDVFIADLINGNGVLYDTIQASAEGTDTLGNAPLLFWDDDFCEELLIQLQRNDGDPDANPVEGLDPGVSATFSYDVVIPTASPNLGTVEILQPPSLEQAWTASLAPTPFILQAASMNTYGRGYCEQFVGFPDEDICEYPNENCFSTRISFLDEPIEADFELVNDGSASPTLACDGLVGFTPGNIALMRRGSCEFGLKAFNAEQAGATAVFMVNDGRCSEFPASDQCVINMAAGTLGGLISIPVVLIAQADGEPVISSVAGGETVRGSFGGHSRYSADGYVFLSDVADTDPDPDNDLSRWVRSIEGVGCAYAVTPDALHHPPAGGPRTVSVSTETECPWSGTTEATWISGAIGTWHFGSGTLDYMVDPNTGPGRAATIDIADQVHYVSQQAGNGCTYTISPAQTSFPGIGGGGSVELVTQPGCEWAAAPTAGWLTLTSPATGTGNAIITFFVEENSFHNRQAAILVADQVHRVSQVVQGGCDYGIITDDGTPENAYGGGIAQALVQRFTPSEYPHVVTGVCMSFTRNGADNLLDFQVLVYNDDGLDGAPGTLLASIPTYSHSIPAWPDSAFHSVDLEGLVPTIVEGSVYIGVGWDGASEVGFFVAADESPGTPLQRGYFSGPGGEWQAIESGFPSYRSLMLRHDGYPAGDGSWTQVVGGVFGGGNGFGNASNASILSMAEYQGAFFAGTTSLDGAEVHYTLDGEQWSAAGSPGLGVPTTYAITHLIEFQDELYATTMDSTFGGSVFRTEFPPSWTQVAPAGFGDPTSSFILSAAVFSGELYTGLSTSAGCEIWRSPDGTSWTQTNSDGFGSTLNSDATSMVLFNGELWVGTYNGTDGAELWRSSDGSQWSQAVGAGLGDSGNRAIRAMAVYDNLLYAATENWTTGAQVWRTVDGSTWDQMVSDGFGNPNNWAGYSFQVDGDRLLAAVSGPASTGTVWISGDGASWSPFSSPGFGDSANAHIYRFVAWNDGLFAGTRNDAEGAELWRTLRLSIFEDGFESGDVSAWNH
jgi:hypothetical protein